MFLDSNKIQYAVRGEKRKECIQGKNWEEVQNLKYSFFRKISDYNIINVRLKTLNLTLTNLNFMHAITVFHKIPS